MELVHQCARCGRDRVVADFGPYMQNGTLVRPDTCKSCVKEVDALRRRHPVDLRWFDLLRKEAERKLGRKLGTTRPSVRK